MGSSRFRVTRNSESQLEIALTGELAEHTVVNAEADARAQVSAARPATVALLVDLRGLTTSTPGARDALVTAQRSLAGKLRQTAYLVDTAAGRGLALWVRHTVQDQVIKGFATHDDALAWFGAEAGPTTGIRPVVRSRRKTPSQRARRLTG